MDDDFDTVVLSLVDSDGNEVAPRLQTKASDWSYAKGCVENVRELSFPQTTKTIEVATLLVLREGTEMAWIDLRERDVDADLKPRVVPPHARLVFAPGALTVTAT
jgi:hypothetical protein